jgi:hypothetical protein
MEIEAVADSAIPVIDAAYRLPGRLVARAVGRVIPSVLPRRRPKEL